MKAGDKVIHTRTKQEFTIVSVFTNVMGVKMAILNSGGISELEYLELI